MTFRTSFSCLLLKLLLLIQSTFCDASLLVAFLIEIARSCRILLMIIKFLSQVNRELMEVIESLQREIAKENKESKEEADGIHEKAKGVDVSNEIVEEAKENNLKGQIESEIHQTEKLKKTSGKCAQKRGRKKGSTSCKQLDDGKNVVDPSTPEKAASEELQDPVAESKV